MLMFLYFVKNLKSQRKINRVIDLKTIKCLKIQCLLLLQSFGLWKIFNNMIVYVGKYHPKHVSLVIIVDIPD